MATNNNINTNNKPLDPNAPPFFKTRHQTLFYINSFAQSTPHFRVFEPSGPQNLHFHRQKPFHRRQPPPPQRPRPPRFSNNFKRNNNNNNNPHNPVALGPRNHSSHIPEPRRWVKKPTQHATWQPKLSQDKKTTPPENIGFVGRKRWKNKRCAYHEILPMESGTTSVMIKNIPNKYKRELLIRMLDNHCKIENEKLDCIDDGGVVVSAYDYLYLPLDFKNGCNAGFGFVNFTTSKGALRFKEAFDGKIWADSDSKKVAQISRAAIQGKNALINNCKKMNFSDRLEDASPVVFEPARDGSGRINSRMIKLGKSFT